jgi:hypothetical protein
VKSFGEQLDGVRHLIIVGQSPKGIIVYDATNASWIFCFVILAGLCLDELAHGPFLFGTAAHLDKIRESLISAPREH